MSSVRMQGVDTIKFDDTYINGQKVNLALGKDTRPFKVKHAFFFETMLSLLIGLGFLFLALAIPSFSVVFLTLSLIMLVAWKGKRLLFLNRQKSLFDKPKYLDYNKEAAALDYAPKENVDEVEKAAKGVGDGVFFFGHELFTNQEIHVADSKVRTHIIIFGTTGSGKTENIISICVNFLTQASGFILVDGKGDTLLFAKVFSLCRAYGRGDDVYLLNFMDKGDSAQKEVERITHKFNFFVDTNASEANEIIGGLLPNKEGGGGDVWEGRATTGIESLNKALYYLKNNGYLEIDPDIYRSYFDLNAFYELAMNDDVPKPYRTGLHTVLTSIGYKIPTDAEPNPKQNSETEVQFQYITMQFTATFNMLAEQYGHITVSQVPDISITDIVLRRRILLVLLPSLSKSEQSVRNLGRIIIAMTRNVSSKAIGNKVEGNIENTIESKPTSAISSYGLIFDEFGAYATKGASTLPAQVRSLNIVCIFAGQDYEAFKKGDEIEAATIFANCTIKICMKLEDPLTYEKFKESAGQRYVMVQESFEASETMFGRKLKPQESARVEKRDVLDITDLKGQGPGEETWIYGSNTYRVQAFYADPKLTKKARLTHFLEIKKPTHPTVTMMQKGVDGLHRSLRKRLDGEWENLEELSKRAVLSFSTFNKEILSVFEALDAKAHNSIEGDALPSETEISIFALATFVKKVELVDYNIKKSLTENLGFDFDEEFDDEALLSGGAILDGFKGKSKTDSSDDARGGHASMGRKPNVDKKPVVNEKIKDKPSLVAIEDAKLKLIEDTINSKKVRLAKAEKESFNSLEALDMSVFDTQKEIQRLEEVLLSKQGYTKKESLRLSELTSSNLVTEMALKTNPAVVSEKERRLKSPSRSTQEVMDMVAGFANQTKK